MYNSNLVYEAFENYEKALKICPLNCKQERAVLHTNKAMCLVKLGRKEMGLQQYSEALKLRPDYVLALLNRGQTYEGMEKLQDALKDFKKVLEFNSPHSYAEAAVKVRVNYI